MAEVIWFKDCSYENKALVGGKNSSLGELFRVSTRLGFQIANGFAISTALYDAFLEENALTESIASQLASVNVDDITELDRVSAAIRASLVDARLSETHARHICAAYDELSRMYDTTHLAVAVRSSAIAEDLENASFAGQQDTFLNVRGHNDILLAVKRCFASLFNSRAISYRKRYDIGISQVKISVAIQKMVRSDIGSAGVAFSIDPESGYDRAIVINAAFGLGELVVSGGVKPDEFIVDKRVLAECTMDVCGSRFGCDPIISQRMGDKQSKIIYRGDDGGTHEVPTTAIEQRTYSMTIQHIKALATHVLALEKNYSTLFEKQIGVDVEWAIDGIDKQIYIIQTRPETIHSNGDHMKLEKYILDATTAPVLVRGVAVGDKISSGKVTVLSGVHEFARFSPGDILVTDMTTPDWEPIMKISAGIITNKGGRTCHAAIVARELRLNAIVGTGNATQILSTGTPVTLSCADGEVGTVYEGVVGFHTDTILVSKDLRLPVALMLNVGNPEGSFSSARIPNSGVGLARLEFIISNYIKVHPLALASYPRIADPRVKSAVADVLGNESDGHVFFIEQLASGIAKIASAFYPKDVIVRFSDFKSNEYRNLIGGELYEPQEENPMIGWRGASRYYSEEYGHAFELECMAIRYARNTMQMTNVVVMIPFCRTPTECRRVLDTMRDYGLVRGENGLRVYLMCEIPSNVIEADAFSPMIDGVSIGGNDLLQLTLGVDRDSEKITHLSDDTNVSYRRLIRMAIQTYKAHGVKIGFCGQQPSDSIEFCNFLIQEGIDSISVTPDSALKTIKNLGA